MAARRAKKRPTKFEFQRGLVVTEGTKTETQYIERLNQHLRNSSRVRVTTIGVGRDPHTVVRKCKELKEEAIRKEKGYDWHACVVDKDRHANLDTAASLAQSNDIWLLITNLKFETWLLWHAVDIRSVQSSTALDHMMKKYNLSDNKGIPNNFPIESVDKAMNIARCIDPAMRSGRIGPDPSSAFPLLVQLMQGTN